jgi:hypothetical protein
MEQLLSDVPYSLEVSYLFILCFTAMPLLIYSHHLYSGLRCTALKWTESWMTHCHVNWPTDSLTHYSILYTNLVVSWALYRKFQKGGSEYFYRKGGAQARKHDPTVHNSAAILISVYCYWGWAWGPSLIPWIHVFQRHCISVVEGTCSIL